MTVSPTARCLRDLTAGALSTGESLRQEGWHFSCVRETIMERQVHFQSSD